jgi:O-acetyl-ADP-ribose deacetylase (regulator of RNase III)
MDKRIHLIKADITKLEVDAIVNAANSSLLGGGGVDGAMHRAAGPDLLHECRLLNGCKTGNAKMTKGYKLPAKYIIHTVGPVWNGGHKQEAELLKSCYEKCMEIATKENFESIAFPNISTGIFGFPKNLACDIAIETISIKLETNSTVKCVYFVCFDAENFELYQSKPGIR